MTSATVSTIVHYKSARKVHAMPYVSDCTCAVQNEVYGQDEYMMGGRTPGHATPGRSPYSAGFGHGTPGRMNPEAMNSPLKSPLAGLNFGAFSPLAGGGFSPTRSPGGGLGGYSPTSPGLCLSLLHAMLAAGSAHQDTVVSLYAYSVCRLVVAEIPLFCLTPAHSSFSLWEYYCMCSSTMRCNLL